MKKIHFIVLIASMFLCAATLMIGCGNPTGGGSSGSSASVGNGILYVADHSNSQILAFDNACTRDGASIQERTISGDATGISALNYNSLFVDPSANKLYVACANQILVFNNASTANGNTHPAQIITSSGNLSNPEGIFVKSGKIFVGDYSGSKIDVFNSTVSGEYAPLATIASAEMVNPCALYVDNNNALYVGFTSTPTGHNNRVFVFNNVMALSGANTIAPNRVIKRSSAPLGYYPSGISMNETKNLLFVASYNAGSIEVFSNASTLNGVSTPEYTVSTNYSFVDIAYDQNKDIVYAVQDLAPHFFAWDHASSIEGVESRTPYDPTFTRHFSAIALDTTRP
jgi:outer membrane protein assembly factor BamB